MKTLNARQFFKDYFCATRNTGRGLMRYFTAAQRDDMLDGVMQWRHTVPTIRKGSSRD